LSLLAGLSLVLSLPGAAQAQGTSQQKFVRTLDRMMVELGLQSARASKTIRHAYQSHGELLVLDRYADLEGALVNGGLAPLPANPLRFNVLPRLDGPFPIGEKDLANQPSYIAARPATIGALLDIASRVKSGPVEVTSLVRHTEYQGALRTTNKNAATSVPMHTMGLAFDIALVNSRLDTVYEIRNVLEKMRDAGEILFIGERRQLVFHVVPHPSRLGHFTNVYTRALGTPAGDDTHLVAFSDTGDHTRGTRIPTVTAEVIAVLPTPEFSEEWWASDHTRADVTIDVSPALAHTAPAVAETAALALVGRLMAILGTLLGIAWRFVARHTRPAVIGAPHFG
jgi:hypothetical protein